MAKKRLKRTTKTTRPIRRKISRKNPLFSEGSIDLSRFPKEDEVKVLQLEKYIDNNIGRFFPSVKDLRGKTYILRKHQMTKKDWTL